MKQTEWKAQCQCCGRDYSDIQSLLTKQREEILEEIEEGMCLLERDDSGQPLFHEGYQQLEKDKLVNETLSQVKKIINKLK